MSKINSEEWVEERKKYIGASQIYSLVSYYCKEELEQLGIAEAPFASAFSLYHQIKNNIVADFDYKISEYGHVVEDFFSYAISYSREDHCFDYQFEEVSRWEDFVIRPDISPLAACSPDFSTKDCLIELKAPLSDFSSSYYKYMFQIQYQMLLTDYKQAKLVFVRLKNNNEFERGKMVAYYELMHDNLPEEMVDLFHANFAIEEKCFDADEGMQDLCKKALAKFSEALELDNEPEVSCFADKEILAKLYPDKYGDLVVDDSLLLSKIEEYQTVCGIIRDIEKEKDLLKISLQRILAENISLQCGNYQLYFDKAGSFRFKTIKQ